LVGIFGSASEFIVSILLRGSLHILDCLFELIRG
jgi:hypothetical protein